MTAREIQEVSKKAGLPWSTAKAQDGFNPVGNFIPKSKIIDPQSVELWLKVNGIEKQRGNTKDMLFPIYNLIAHISSMFTLEEGDLILTGTPSGVGPVKAGDVVTAGITGLSEYDISFSAEQRKQSPMFQTSKL